MGDKDTVKVLGFWVSPFVLRVVWALKIKGVDYEYIEEDIFNKSSILKELNPVHQRVPVLVHGQKVLAESMVILEYIDETWKHCPLMPQDPYERALARFWAKSVEEKLLEGAWAAMMCQGIERERGLKQAIEIVEKVEEQLQGRSNLFFGGENIGYLDIALAWISYMLPVWEEVGSLKILDTCKFPALTSWTRRLLELPLMRDNLPPRDRMFEYFHKRRQELLSNPPRT
ncbi:hypothetical protein K2173_011459 [Erythroxylum novogranatense]|uniref:Glutathione S-transferase n=1 Tax=Erythroxylum novogranatense TaxID=1862640 RepID=A0AAV8TGA2_9ROSI|nr:hypothetical protein K2173_011459 [Erythroxylum novogranatense]